MTLMLFEDSSSTSISLTIWVGPSKLYGIVVCSVRTVFPVVSMMGDEEPGQAPGCDFDFLIIVRGELIDLLRTTEVSNALGALPG
jgi:hypothetical protein